jgi:hypothetical protein
MRLSKVNNPLCKELKDLYFPMRKIGKWTILANKDNDHSLCVCDGYWTEWVIIYNDYKIGYDFPEKIPSGVRQWISNYARKIELHAFAKHLRETRQQANVIRLSGHNVIIDLDENGKAIVEDDEE